MPRVITLGKEGLLADPDLKIDYLMASFFFSKHSQTTLYRGNITSLTKLIQLHGNDPLTMKRELEDALIKYLRKYFPSVDITVTVEDPDEPGIKLQLNGMVSNETSIQINPISIGYSLYTRDSIVKSIIKLTTGEAILTT